LAWLHGFVARRATAYIIDPTRSHAPAERLLGLDYHGTLIHDGWAPYDRFVNARHQQCNRHILRRCDEMLQTATRAAVKFPRRVAALLRQGLALRDRHAAGDISSHGLSVARGQLQRALEDAVYPSKTNAANERLAQHLWQHIDQFFTFLSVPGLDATNWRAELAMRFGVILRKVWGGSRTWTGAQAQAVLMSVWRTCWQRGVTPLDFLSDRLRCRMIPAALPP
jgi:transposase